MSAAPLNAYMFTQINDIEQTKTFLKPLLSLASSSRTQLLLAGKKDALRSGKYLKKVRVVFDVADLSKLYIPCHGTT